MRNIKTLNLLLFFLISKIAVVAQTNKQYFIGKVSYSVSLHLDRNSGIYKIYEEFSPKLIARAELIDSEVDYSLVFNNSTSLFYLEDKLFFDDRAANFVIRKSSYYGRIKQQSSNYITEELEEDFGKFLVSRPYQKWEFHDEKKK
jgi:GLPGLI family protein